jgi:hypothetical protein
MTKVRKTTNPVLGDGSTMKRYLLGDLAEEQCEQLEERLLTEDETFQEILLVEDELVNDYLSGELPAGDRERFSNHFLCTPERHQKLEFASALRRYVSETTAAERLVTDNNTRQPLTWRQSFSTFVRSQNPVMAGSLAAALSVIMVGGPWSIFQITKLQNQISRIRSEQSLQAQNEQDLRRQFAEQLASSNEQADELARKLNKGTVQLTALRNFVAKNRDLVTPKMVSLALTSARIRGSEGATLGSQGGRLGKGPPPPGSSIGNMNKLLIASDSSWVQLKLNLPLEEHAKYRAILQDVRGGDTTVRDNLTPRLTNMGRAVVFTVPADLFLQADYVVRLIGITAPGEFEDVEEYYFRVIKE